MSAPTAEGPAATVPAMELLIIGGTKFLGRHVAEQALERGHELTLLHRGRSGPDLFPQARHLIADRDADLTVLSEERWDAVIDTSAYVPRQVRSLAARLAGRVGHYQLVSSISVYSDLSRAGMDERADTAVLADPLTETVTGETYGGLKRLCEEAALQCFGAATLIVRPGLIVGPHDPTGRFTWWLARMQRGGEVLAPGDPAAPVQFIDVRDLAAWMLAMAEQNASGVFNATGPEAPMTIGEWLEQARETLAPAGTTLRWADEAWLLEHGVTPWSDLPLWLPTASRGLLEVNVNAARTLGLRCRPLVQTLADTATWARMAGAANAAPGDPPPPAVGLAPERETDLLALLTQSTHLR